MIKVVKDPETYIVECHRCGALLEYNKADTRQVHISNSECFYEIGCPLCGWSSRALFIKEEDYKAIKT